MSAAQEKPDLASPPALPERAAVGGGLKYFDSRLSREATALQKTVAFIGSAQGRLAEIRRASGAAIAARQVGACELAKLLHEFAEYWQSRAVATDGSLDQQLRLRGEKASRQTFSLRGLDAEALRDPVGETLQFMVRGQLSASLVFGPEQSMSAKVRSLDRVLAPLGVRVEADAGRVVRFSAAESEWSAIRDDMQVRGAGRLFPTGQFNRLRAEKTADEIQPGAWRADDLDAVRDTLQQAVRLGSMLEKAAGEAGQQLDALSTPDDPAETMRAQALVLDFLALAGRDDFRSTQAILPAVTGLHRSRVLAVLGVPI